MIKFLIFSLVLIQILPEHLCDEITEDNDKAVEDSGESPENNGNVAIVQSDSDDSSEFRRNNDGENKDNFNKSHEETNVQPPFIGSDHDDEEILRINFRSTNKPVENATKRDTPEDPVYKAQETVLQGDEPIRVNVTNDNQNSAATSEDPKKIQSIESTTISKLHEAHILANKPVNEIDKDKDKVKEANETTSKENVGPVAIGASIDELVENFVKTSAKTVATPSPYASHEIIYFGKTEKDDVPTKTIRHDRASTDASASIDKQSQNQDKSATVITEKVKLVSGASDKVPVKVSALTTAADKFEPPELKPTTVGQNNHWNSNASGLFLFRRNKINDYLAGSDFPYSKVAMDPETERKTEFLIKMVNNIAVDQTLLRDSKREPSRPILRILEPKQPNIVDILNNMRRRALLEQDRLHYINNPEVLENYIRRRSLNRRSGTPNLDEGYNNMRSKERYKLTEDNRDNYYVDKKRHRLKKKHIKEAMEKQKKADRERRYKERRKAKLFSRRSLSDLLSGTADITNIYPESDAWEHRRRRPNNRQIKAQRRLIFHDQMPINIHLNREDRIQESIQQQLRPIDHYQQETDKLWRNYDRHIFTSLEDNEDVIKMDPHQARRMFLRKVRALRAKNKSTDESETDEETDKIDVFDADAEKFIKVDAKKDIKNNDQDDKVKDAQEEDKEDDKDKKEDKDSEEDKDNKEDKGTVTRMEDWNSLSASNEDVEKDSEKKSKEVALIRSETKDKKMEKDTLNSKIDWYKDIDAQDFKNVNFNDGKDKAFDKQNKWNEHKDTKDQNSDEIDKLKGRPIKLTSADKIKKEDTSIKEKSVTPKKKSEWDNWPPTVKSFMQKKVFRYDFNDKPRDMTERDNKGYSDKKKYDDYDGPRYKKDDPNHSSHKIDDFAKFSNKKEDSDRFKYKKTRFDGPSHKKEDDDEYNSKSKKTRTKHNSNKDKFDRPSDKKDDFDRPNYKKDDFGRPSYKENSYDDYTNKGKKSKLKANNDKYDFDQSSNKKDDFDRPNFEQDDFDRPSHKKDDHGNYKSKTTDFKSNNDKYYFDRPSIKKDDFDHKKDDFYGPDYKKDDDYYNSRSKKWKPKGWNDKFDKDDFDRSSKKDEYAYGKINKKNPKTDSDRNNNDQPSRYKDNDDYKKDDSNRYKKDDYDYHSSKSKTSKKSSDGSTHKWDKIDNDWSKVGIPSKKSAKDRLISNEKPRSFQNKRKDSYEYKDRDIDIIDSREKKQNREDKRIDYDDDRGNKYLSKKNKNKDYNDGYEDKVKDRKKKSKEYDDDKYKERSEKDDVNKNQEKYIYEKDNTSATKVTKKSFKRRDGKSKSLSNFEDNFDPKYSKPLRSGPIIQGDEDIPPDNAQEDHDNENKYQGDDQKGNKDISRGHKDDKKRVDHVFFNKENDWSKIGVDDTKKNPPKRPLKPWKVHDDVDDWGKGMLGRERGQNTHHVGAHTVIPSKLLKGLFEDY